MKSDLDVNLGEKSQIFHGFHLNLCIFGGKFIWKHSHPHCNQNVVVQMQRLKNTTAIYATPTDTPDTHTVSQKRLNMHTTFKTEVIFL